MKKTFIISALFAACVFTSCQDCKDCQSTSNITLLKEFYNLDNGSYLLDSTKTHTHTAIGGFVPPSYKEDSLVLHVTPISILELCDSDLSERDGKSFSFEVPDIGDSATGLYKYSWIETWDCK